MDIFSFVGSGPLSILALVVVILMIMLYLGTRYHVAGADEALIISGQRGAKLPAANGTVAVRDDRGLKVVVGGGAFVLPLIHKMTRMQLFARQIEIKLNDAVTKQGIRVEVGGVATFKVGRDVESIRNAAERFTAVADEEIKKMVAKVMEGSLRSIVGTLTIEQLISDRQSLQQQVQEAAMSNLENAGLKLDNFNIQSITDSSDYISFIGQRELAVVQRDARIAQAQAAQEAAVSEADSQRKQIEAKQSVDIRQAEALMAVAAADARAEQAGPLAKAEAQREVTTRQTELAQLEAQRTEQELIATLIKPAEAERAATIARAEGDRQASIAHAGAEAEGVRLAGVARASATLAQGIAEAEALEKKAQAYRQFEAAAILSAVLETAPKIMAEAARPMEKIDHITVISTNGASDVVRTGTEVAAQGLAALESFTGINLRDTLAAALAGVGSASAGKNAATDKKSDIFDTTSEQAASVSTQTAVQDDDQDPGYNVRTRLALLLKSIPDIKNYRNYTIREMIARSPVDLSAILVDIPESAYDLKIGDLLKPVERS